MDAEVRAGTALAPPAGPIPAAFVLSFLTAISKDPGPGEQDPPARRLAHSPATPAATLRLCRARQFTFYPETPEDTMKDDCGNIYRNARRAAGYTQQHWAEFIGVSTEAVRQYETGVNMPGDAIVLRMADISGMKILPYWHLSQKSRLAAAILPELEEQPALPEAVLGLLIQIEDIRSDVMPELIRIAADGKVDDEERESYLKAIEKLKAMIRTAMQKAPIPWKLYPLDADRIMGRKSPRLSAYLFFMHITTSAAAAEASTANCSTSSAEAFAVIMSMKRFASAVGKFMTEVI